MSDPVFADINGKHYTISSAVPVGTPTQPIPPGTPTIPSNAKTLVLDSSNAWKGVHDETTGGSATGFTKYLGTGKGRMFQNQFKNNAGYRWHNVFAKDTQPNHYCYKLGVAINNPAILGCLELDFTHVIATNKVVYPCLQVTNWNKCWEYTTTPSGKCQWNNSNIKADPASWPPNAMQQIELHLHRDDSGIVTYEGVGFNGVYTPFSSNCKGLSMLHQDWTVGDLLINFQLGGKGSSGTLEATALNLTVSYWRA